MADQDRYSTVAPMFGSLQNWVADEQERRRIASYAVYESIYWSNPGTFKLVTRGEEDKPIYVPSGRIIVETLHRYLANDLTFTVEPRDPTGEVKPSTDDFALATQVIDDLMARERFLARFNSNKRYGIMRGDWAFHLYADPARMPGSKLSVFAVDPASLFPVYETGNPDNIIGWHIAEAFKDNDGKDYIKRLTYRKVTGTGGPSAITSEIALFKLDNWGGPGMEQAPKPEVVLQPLQTLPAPIDQLPIYLIPNFEEPGTIWGSSEMRGLETLMRGLNQSVSDEDISLALDGLGVWVTDAGTPVDENGDEVPWNLGPGRVVEVGEGKEFKRANSTSTVVPYQQHVDLLQNYLDWTMGISGVAKGKVDVQTAESGVALLLEMAPLLARVDEKELTIEAVMSNMMYDLTKWLVAYEGSTLSPLMNVKWVPHFGPHLPRDRKAEIDELFKLAAISPQILPLSYIRNRLRQLGYEDMPEEAALAAELQKEQELRISTQQDAFGARVDQEVNGELANSNGQTS